MRSSLAYVYSAAAREERASSQCVIVSVVIFIPKKLHLCNRVI
jgi:hypothetical protein